MITVTKQENGALFTFQDSDKYLYGSGTIEVPFNSLSIIQDESDMITLRKSASNDIFLSARYDTDLGYRSKDEAVEALKGMLFAETGGGSGSGMTPSEVQTMIDESVSGKADTAVVNQAISDATAAIISVSGATENLNDRIDGVWDTIDEKEEVIASALTEVRQDVADIDAKEEVIASALTEVNLALDNKLDASAYTPTDLSEYWTSAQTQNAIDDAKAYYISFATIATTGIRDEDWDGIVAAIDAHRPIYAGYPKNDGGILYYGVECMNKNVSNTQIILTSSDDSVHYFYTFTKNGSNDYTFTSETRPYVTDAEKTAWNAKQDALSAGTGIEINGNVISATGGGSVTVDPTLDSGSTNPVANSAITNAITAHTADTTVHVTAANKNSWNAAVISANNALNALGGLYLEQISQSDYDQLVNDGRTDRHTLYIITNVVS